MPASPRKLALLGLAIVAYSCVAVLIATAFSPPVPENPTCAQLRSDRTSRATVVRLAREFEPPPGVTPPEMSQAVQSTLVTECARYRGNDGREGRRRPLGADLRGTVSRRLRELEARRR